MSAGGDPTVGPRLVGLALPTRTVGLRCDDAALRGHLAATFAGLVEPLGDLDETWGIRLEDGSWVFDAPGRGLDGRSAVSPTSVANRLQTELNAVVCEHACAAGRVLLHAGTLTLDGATLLLVGTSGAGKTTLTAALLAVGARYLSDEFAVLDPATRSVAAYAKPLTVKRGARGIIAELGIVAELGVGSGEAAPREDVGLELLPVPAGRRAATAPWPALLVLLDGSDEGATGMLHPADVYVALAEHSPCRAETLAQLPHLAALAREVPTVRLPRGQAAGMAAQVAALAREVTDG